MNPAIAQDGFVGWKSAGLSVRHGHCVRNNGREKILPQMGENALCDFTRDQFGTAM
jgi:hypothetical protein